MNGSCTVVPGDYFYGNVNVVAKGSLIFKEGSASAPADQKKSNFWAKSIIIENGGKMLAGVGTDKPYGTNGYELNIILYGKDQSNGDPRVKQGAGVPCVMPRATEPAEKDMADCGVPKSTVWDTNGSREVPLPGVNKPKDYFYEYGQVHGDGAKTNGKLGHFGYKVLALSYGGTLQLRGLKGTTGGAKADSVAAAKGPGFSAARWQTDSGTSWIRLAVDLKGKTSRELVLDRPVDGDWQPGDKIVVTTTDYMPDHSEELTIAKNGVSGNKITVEKAVEWDHVGHRYALAAALAGAGDGFKNAGMDPELKDSAETRAAVALLTRSIRFVSGGDVANETFDEATKRDPHYSFGGHTVFRQGFEKLQLQGVEFHQFGQGGRLAHYPVHFHMARKVPNETYIKDSSVSESMTRWYVLHSTLGVTLQRNVGWKSIGHGYYLEDATETDNKFYANIGIFARPAVVNATWNPRNIPGILAYNGREGDPPRVRSDVMYPAVFWITNGWNDFVGNMAVGAGSCGACYWLLAAENADMIEVGGNMSHMKWSGYAGRQTSGHAGETPLKLFYKNYCSTAMHSLDTTTEISACNGVRFVDEAENGRLAPVPSIAPKPNLPKPNDDTYYPHVYGTRAPSVCDPTKKDTDPGGCSVQSSPRCANGDARNCATYVIDHYTTSFNWAETNFSAIWLRNPGWFVLDNSFISDVQNGGVTLVSGGDYSESAAPKGYWALVSRSIFVGETQPDNPFAKAGGPTKPDGTLACALGQNKDNAFDNACINQDAGVAFPLTAWAANQRMFNIYDGPAYQDGNAYLNIKVSPCSADKNCMYFGKAGVRRYPNTQTGYLPNAAIGWKQPNGFYYPPAFHSQRLFFKDVDIRHYVIEPVLEPGTYLTYESKLAQEFIGIRPGTKNLFSSYTDIDRQTELNDDDGTLTGFVNTVSVNEDAFFGAPIQAAECKANVGVDPATACGGKVNKTTPTARTSPYDYVTTVIYPECATRAHFDPNYTMCGTTKVGPDTSVDGNLNHVKAKEGRGGTWSKDCAGPFCTGVPIYRQYLTGVKAADKDGNATATTTREWLPWLKNNCNDPSFAAKPACNFPFARMAGAAEWQRNVMTVNNGKYYIDTTPAQLTQQHTEALGGRDDASANYVECGWKTATGNCSPRSVNVFQEKQTYYVFFLFAKKDTRQAYQIYVGEKFDLATVKGVRITGRDISFATAPWDLPAAWKPKWVDGAPGVIEVPVDFSAVKEELDPRKTTNQTCKPSSFCSWNGSACGCSEAAKNNPLANLSPTFRNTCDQTCKTWAVKDLDCPEVGCLGFAFTLPEGFKAADQYKRPKPEMFPIDEEPWKGLVFTRTKQAPDATKGDCYYSDANTPGIGACKVPD